ncbi:glycosyltransferase family 90 protein [Bipolaris victoriae FI3]|uniref:Glycosyltransferase family 90 protein n=1 Tax=Bipolaris victoriae (strain FI3) TaxID=930091 RepID=W7ENN3_BIPV3|nr:glycosyltransferase family 90 protein [Bipolaris victoriae FI3]
MIVFVSLVPNLDTKTLASAIPITLGFVGTYASLIHIFGAGNDQIDGKERLETPRVIFSIASRTTGLLIAVSVIMVFTWPASTLDITNATLAGAGTLGVAQTFTRTTIAIMNLYQTIDFIPKTEKGRGLLVAFALWPVSSFVQHTPLSQDIISLPGPSDNISHHPVELLVLKAQDGFRHLVDKQSKTLESAETEYRRRYSRPPPPGFAQWFAYAKSKNSILIDDFDMINEDLKPFWKIAPQQLHESINHVSSFEHLALRKCGFTDGRFHGQGGGWIVEDLGKLLQEVSQGIPNVEFAFDVVDEPRVIITEQMLDTGGVSKPEFYDAHHQPIWDRTTSVCAHPSSPGKTSIIHDYGLNLVQDWHQSKDVCSHPEFSLMHGFFSSPMTSLLTDAPIPVLSQAAPTSFGDIMYPSPWYTAKMDQGVYKDEDDPLWEQKARNLYWAGSTTGSYSWNGTWRHSHRQRFVELVQTLNQTSHMYLEESKPGQWTSYKAVEDHSDLFDVKLTAIIQCDDQDCEEQKKFFTLGEKEERSRQFHSQFVFDVDGNSFSGRFYTLLRSRSVVLKQTVLREWHDERLIPWVHFIPISLSMDELPEVMRYMTSHEEGRRRAKEIADAGREWHGKFLRKEDFTIYLYRLMLELARIMDPNRQVEH